jgi:hypothetical protein
MTPHPEIGWGTVFVEDCCRIVGMIRRIALLVLVVGLLPLTACTKWAEKKQPGWKMATSGEHLTNLFWNEVKQKNWKELEAHVGGEFVGISEAQTMDRAALMEHLRGIDLQGFQIGEIQTRSAGSDLIVSYVITSRGTQNGKAIPPTPVRMLAVWQELKHGWVLVAHSDVESR